jgi:hypothetical protein
MTAAEIKARTNELYASLPLDEEERKSRLDVREEVIKLNYDFFKFVASRTHPVGNHFDFDDKVNSGILYFFNIWHQYHWEGHTRMDLCFSTYFYPRVSKGLYQDLSDIKYTPKRQLTRKIAKQLGKHWAEVRKEDLADPRLVLSPADRKYAETLFEIPNMKSLDDVGMYIPHERSDISIADQITDEYDSIEDLLIKEMVYNEKKLSDNYLQKLADMLCLDIDDLMRARPLAEEMLLERLRESQFLKDTFV